MSRYYSSLSQHRQRGLTLGMPSLMESNNYIVQQAGLLANLDSCEED